MGSVATRSSSAPPARGFTLIEILVVLVVLGIAAGLISLRVGGDEGRDAEREARRMAGALEHAAAAAQWQHETLGVSSEGTAYRFWRRQDRDRWIPETGDDVLAPRRLPASIRIAIASFAGAPVAADAVIPFRPSGRNEPLEIEVASSGARYRVVSDPLNRVRIDSTANAGGPAAPR